MTRTRTAKSREDHGEQAILSATTTRDELHPPRRLQRRGPCRDHYHHGARTPAAAGTDLAALQNLIHPLLIYVLSFTFIAIYWNNHHHLLRATHRISSGVMWANFHLLFWLSLVPVVTAWVGANGLSRWPAVTYGAIGFLAGVAFYVLMLTIRNVNKDTRIPELLGRNIKGNVSIALYAVGIALAFVEPLLAFGAYALVAIMWFIPDRRFANSGDNPA